jgi:hypothetical protein
MLSHGGLGRPEVADREKRLQLCGVAANVLKKQSWTAYKGWFSSFVAGHGANNSSL